MDDNSDAHEVIHRAIADLRLAGVDDSAIAGALMGQGLNLRLMQGASVDETVSEIEAMIKALAEHISKDD